MNDRSALEIEFFSIFNTSIDQLVRNNFPEQDSQNFINAVKTFLKFDDIKDFVQRSLYNKAMELSNVFAITEEIWSYSYRKFIAMLVSLDDTNVNEMLETNFVKERKLNNFFILIEEKLKQNKNVENCETLFLSLMTIKPSININTVDLYLSALQKDRTYIVQKLITSGSYSALRRYMFEILEYDPNSLPAFVPVIVEKYYDRLSNHYLELVSIILRHSKEFTNQLLPSRNLEKMFEQYLLTSYGPMPSIINYASHLVNKDKQLFESFEKSFIETAVPLNMITFATDIPASNKRKLLNRLIELREADESCLILFIKHFPEFENLLPML